MYNFELFQRGFLTPLKRNVHFFIPTQAGLQKFVTPLTCRPPPYCWLKNNQPLITKHPIYIEKKPALYKRERGTLYNNHECSVEKVPIAHDYKGLFGLTETLRLNPNIKIEL